MIFNFGIVGVSFKLRIGSKSSTYEINVEITETFLKII